MENQTFPFNIILSGFLLKYNSFQIYFSVCRVPLHITRTINDKTNRILQYFHYFLQLFNVKFHSKSGSMFQLFIIFIYI